MPDPKPLVLVPIPVRPPVASSSGVQRQSQRTSDFVIPAKRPAGSPVKSNPTTPEPPRKLQKVGPTQRPLAIPQAPGRSESGVPILRVNAAHSLVPIPVRQTMLKTLYDHFLVLYHNILPSNPTLASDHALKQEEEVYKKSTKATYRNAVIQCITVLKRRPIPISPSDPSVGTEQEIASRVEAQKKLDALQLSSSSLEHLVHSVEELQKWGYFIDIPPGPGGDQPSMEGKTARCDRCPQYFMVKKAEEAEQCVYHWGKAYTTRVGGEKVRTYTCCSRPVADGGGCSHGPHVFYDTEPALLHSRHAFSFLPNPAAGQDGPSSGILPSSRGTPRNANTKLDVAALDCEMVYTTGGMRVARVSVIDGTGKEVFDELIKMDEGVEVIDYNTRFSGITPTSHALATYTLSTARDALNALIDARTILIGHALDNDLKTLRIIHHRCIDTALLFPHKAGVPYRRSLRDLVREKLGKMIQTAGAEGHSSVEDASATLDLVRWFILNKQKSAIHADVGS